MIDIIIPVYNSIKTLDKTLSSILCQINTPKLDIYIVDDGSTDDYDSIIKYYKKKMNIIYLKLDKNYGPGYAREYGLKASKGKYIIFLDSDDLFSSPLSVNTLYEEIKNKRMDVITSIICEEKEDDWNFYENEFLGLHGKIYKRSFLEKNNIHFNATRSNEDIGFNTIIKLYGARYSGISELTYIWRNNPNSITRVNSDKYAIIDLENLAYNLYWALDIAVKKKCDKETIKVVSLDSILIIYDRVCGTKIEYLNEKAKLYIKKIYNIYSDYCNSISIENTVYEYNLIDNFSEFKEDFFQFLNYIGIKKLIKNNTINYSQKERKERGLVFMYSEKEFGEEKRKYIELMNQYNQTSPYENEKRKDLINKMFGKVGEYCTIEPPIFSNWGGKNVYIGEDAYINYNLSLVDDGNIYIGDSVLIGPNVTIITTNHPINPNLRLSKALYVRDVKIGNNVWIGAGTIILPGVEIGDNTVIGAGSTVTKNIPSNVIAVGNPCKVLRKINEKDEIYFYKNEKIDWDNF